MDLFAELEEIKYPSQREPDAGDEAGPAAREIGVGMSELHAIVESARARGYKDGFAAAESYARLRNANMREAVVDSAMRVMAGHVVPLLTKARTDDADAGEALDELLDMLSPLASHYDQLQQQAQNLQERLDGISAMSGFPRVG